MPAIRPPRDNGDRDAEVLLEVGAIEPGAELDAHLDACAARIRQALDRLPGLKRYALDHAPPGWAEYYAAQPGLPLADRLFLHGLQVSRQLLVSLDFDFGDLDLLVVRLDPRRACAVARPVAEPAIYQAARAKVHVRRVIVPWTRMGREIEREPVWMVGRLVHRGWAMVTRVRAVVPLMRALTRAAGRVIAEEKAILRDGSAIVIRPLATGDVTAITTWFEGLGPETRYARFLEVIDRLDDRWLSLLAQVDHREHEALTAVTAEGVTVGIARYIRLPGSGTAEVAIAVADRWAGHGIAGLLLQRIAAQARAAGIDRLTALCLYSNEAILHLFTKLGPTAIISPPDDAGAVEVQIDLGPVSVTARHQRERPDAPAG